MSTTEQLEEAKKRMEPNLPGHMLHEIASVSAAISLKRMADAAEVGLIVFAHFLGVDLEAVKQHGKIVEPEPAPPRPQCKGDRCLICGEEIPAETANGCGRDMNCPATEIPF